MRPCEQVASQLLKEAAVGSDSTILEDELSALGVLDEYARKLRSRVFALSELHNFHTVQNVCVVEDPSTVDHMCQLEIELKKSSASPLIARFVRNNGLGFFAFKDVQRVTRQLIEFVTTGVGSDDDALLNTTVERWIKKVTEAGRTALEPGAIFTRRFRSL